jgi:hypothetical protein
MITTPPPVADELAIRGGSASRDSPFKLEPLFFQPATLL